MSKFMICNRTVYAETKEQAVEQFNAMLNVIEKIEGATI